MRTSRLRDKTNTSDDDEDNDDEDNDNQLFPIPCMLDVTRKKMVLSLLFDPYFICACAH